MKFLYILEISWRNLMSRKIRSAVTISGVIIGITTIVFLTSLGYGIEKMTTSQIASEQALKVLDVNVDESDIVAISEEHLAEIRNINDVAAVHAGIKIAGKVSNGLVKTDVIIKGYSRDFLEVSATDIYKGQQYIDSDENKILISTNALKLMNVDLNDFTSADLKVEALASEVLSPTLAEGKVMPLGSYLVVGVIDDEESPFIVMPVEQIKDDLRVTNYNEVKVVVSDKTKVQEVRSAITKMGFTTAYLGDTITQITTIFVFFRYIIGGFGLIAMLVAILGMFNTLTVSLLERTREIGVLKANNATKKDIFLMFLSEALIISFIGGVLGIASGVASGKLVNFWFNFYALRSGSNPLALFYVPSVFVFFTVAMVSLVGFLTGLYPATRATKIKILDALKYE